jgi:hypothetical protein
MGSGCAKPAVNEEEMFTGRRNLGDFLTERARVITDELVQYAIVYIQCLLCVYIDIYIYIPEHM